MLADYGTNLKGEIEVFAFIGRADPDPKGFAWLATLIGLFETGYIVDTGFFERDVRERHVQAPGMHQRLADGIRRGKVVSETTASTCSTSSTTTRGATGRRGPRDARRAPKSAGAIEGGSAGVFELAGMSEMQQRFAAQRRGADT